VQGKVQPRLGNSTCLERVLELEDPLESSYLVRRGHLIWSISALPFCVENFSCYLFTKKNKSPSKGKKNPYGEETENKGKNGWKSSGSFNSSFSYLDSKSAVFR